MEVLGHQGEGFDTPPEQLVHERQVVDAALLEAAGDRRYQRVGARAGRSVAGLGHRRRDHHQEPGAGGPGGSPRPGPGLERRLEAGEPLLRRAGQHEMAGRTVAREAPEALVPLAEWLDPLDNAEADAREAVGQSRPGGGPIGQEPHQRARLEGAGARMEQARHAVGVAPEGQRHRLVAEGGGPRREVEPRLGHKTVDQAVGRVVEVVLEEDEDNHQVRAVAFRHLLRQQGLLHGAVSRNAEGPDLEAGQPLSQDGREVLVVAHEEAVDLGVPHERDPGDAGALPAEGCRVPESLRVGLEGQTAAPGESQDAGGAGEVHPAQTGIVGGGRRGRSHEP